MLAVWILVADSSYAHIFSGNNPKGSLQEVASFTHAESRMHERELTSDLPGRAFDSGGRRRHAMGQSVEPKQQEAIVFAKQLVDYLDAGRKSGQYGKLYVLAAPAFLGHLRKQYTPALVSILTSEVGKDLTDMNADEIRSRLPTYL